MNGSRPSISVIDPIAPAFDRMTVLLFRPFDLRKWFIIGFCAWLASLGEGGASGSFNYNFGSGRGRDGGGNVRRELERGWEFVSYNLYWIIPTVVAVVIFCVTLWVLIVWLSSRGRFMFLHCAALDRAEVAVPWRRYAREANSLFWFRIVLGLIAWVLCMVPVTAAGIAVFLMVQLGHATLFGVLAAVVAVFCLIGISIAFAVVAKFTKDLVVPIMYLRGSACLEGWRTLLRLMEGRKIDMALYILIQIAMAIVIGVGVFAVVIITCCVAGCLFAIPYLGAVALLPVSTFKLCYALRYLAQFGPEWNVFLLAESGSNSPQ